MILWACLELKSRLWFFTAGLFAPFMTPVLYYTLTAAQGRVSDQTRRGVEIQSLTLVTHRWTEWWTSEQSTGHDITTHSHVDIMQNIMQHISVMHPAMQDPPQCSLTAPLHCSCHNCQSGHTDTGLVSFLDLFFSRRCFEWTKRRTASPSQSTNDKHPMIGCSGAKPRPSPDRKTHSTNQNPTNTPPPFHKRRQNSRWEEKKNGNTGRCNSPDRKQEVM